MNKKFIKISIIIYFFIFFTPNSLLRAEESCDWGYIYTPGSGGGANYKAGCTYPSVESDSSKCQGKEKPANVSNYLNKFACCCKSDIIINEAKKTLFTAPDLQINIPGMEKLSNIDCAPGDTCEIPWLGQYIKGIYNYAIAIAGILAAVVMMGGGLLWLISRGDASQITKAKELILGSIIGFIILTGSYLILTLINPDLVNLKSISVTNIKPTDLEPLSYEGNEKNSNECFNCTTLSVPTKNGKLANIDLSKKLDIAWNSSKKNWRVTEAYPWSSPHQSKCHYNGTCVDIGLTTEKKTCADVDNLITLLKNAGLKVLNEYTDCNGKKTKYSTGGHIHVY